MISPISIPQADNVEGLRSALTTILNHMVSQLNSSTPTQVVDNGGQRITNVGNPSTLSDAIPLRYLQERLEESGKRAFRKSADYTNRIIQELGLGIELGGHAFRPSTPSWSGQLFWETDRRTMYVSGDYGVGLQWKVVWSGMIDTLSAIPTDLTEDDTHFLFTATDYDRTWKWNGTGWERAPNERPVKEVGWFCANPGTGWALCNGGTVTITKADATTESFTTPDLIDYYLKGGIVYTGSGVAEVLPTVSGTAANAGAHTPTGSVSVGAAIGSVTAGTGSSSAATNGHSHGASFVGDSVSDHTHTLSLTVDTGGEPAHTVLIPYLRQ